MRLLLVEDDRELRATLREALAVEGYEVLTAASLADAMAQLAHGGAVVGRLDDAAHQLAAVGTPGALR